MTNRQFIEEHRNYDKDTEQEVRLRKLQRQQELATNQPLLPPQDNSNNLTNAIINKFSNLPQLFRDVQLSRNLKIGILTIIASLILTYFLLPEKQPSHFFKEFAHTTKKTFEEINSVDLPASSLLTQHTVSSRNAANLVQNSPAFKDHGSQIASGLRDFGEKITLAGRHLQNMYNKGSSVYKSFDIEIDAMMNRLNLNQKKCEAKYFKNKLNKLITKIKDFRQLVETTQSSIVNAEETRHDTEGYIIDGLREAERYINGNNDESPQSSQTKSVDLSRAQKELAFVTTLLDHLNNTAVHLDTIRNILSNYEDKLLNVEAELSSSGKDDEGFFEVTKEDLKYLKQAVEALKASHYKFNKLSN